MARVWMIIYQSKKDRLFPRIWGRIWVKEQSKQIGRIIPLKRILLKYLKLRMLIYRFNKLKDKELAVSSVLIIPN
jgi:hypothetical protein